jgi:hypothetical protein
MSLQDAAYLAEIVVALVGLPVQFWMLYRVCQMAKIIKRHHELKHPAQ